MAIFSYATNGCATDMTAFSGKNVIDAVRRIRLRVFLPCVLVNPRLVGSRCKRNFDMTAEGH